MRYCPSGETRHEYRVVLVASFTAFTALTAKCCEMRPLTLPCQGRLEIPASEACAADEPGPANHSAASLTWPLALDAGQERELIQAAAGQQVGHAHGLCCESGVSRWTSGPVSGKLSASTSRSSIEPSIRSAWGNAAASLSEIWNKVRTMRPVFASRYRHRQYSTSFRGPCMARIRPSRPRPEARRQGVRDFLPGRGDASGSIRSLCATSLYSGSPLLCLRLDEEDGKAAIAVDPVSA